MKVLRLVLFTLILLAAPTMAAEYQGKNIDGRKLAAKAYYSGTGGVYRVQVQFKRNRATIYFAGGSQTTIHLRQQVITDPSNIEGFGRPGLVNIGGIFSAGLDYDNDNISNFQPTGSHPPEGFWRISLDPTELPPKQGANIKANRIPAPA